MTSRGIRMAISGRARAAPSMARSCIRVSAVLRAAFGRTLRTSLHSATQAWRNSTGIFYQIARPPAASGDQKVWPGSGIDALRTCPGHWWRHGVMLAVDATWPAAESWGDGTDLG